MVEFENAFHVGKEQSALTPLSQICVPTQSFLPAGPVLFRHTARRRSKITPRPEIRNMPAEYLNCQGRHWSESKHGLRAAGVV